MFECRPGKAHLYATDGDGSGYCVHGCGNRDDGLVRTRHGDIIAYPPTPEPLDLGE